MDNNLDKNTMDNIKNLVDSGNISDAISQISPEMIQNFSKMFNNQNNQNNSNTNQNNNYDNNSNTQAGGFDFSNIDMNTIKKMSSVLGNMNSSNDSRSNLLNSLKPYLRDSKKNKLDNYVNLLNMSKIAEIMKNNNKENNNNV